MCCSHGLLLLLLLLLLGTLLLLLLLLLLVVVVVYGFLLLRLLVHVAWSWCMGPADVVRDPVAASSCMFKKSSNR
jgi:membrane protein required for beta-lactamase induction